MSAPRFYCPGALEAGTTIELPPPAFHHAVRVRRLRIGDPLVLFAGDGFEAEATLTSVRRDAADATITSRAAVDRESPLAVTLVQGISTGDRMDYTLQKAVELGVAAIAPVWTARAQRVGAERADKRLAHWRQLVISACEQSGRNRIPEVLAIVPLADALVRVQAPTAWVLAAGASARLRELAQPEGPVVLLAGPEGGLTEVEEQAARDAGYVPVSLGSRILRTETAAVAALASMQCLWGDG